MHWLLFAVLLDFGFVQFFKLGQRRGYYAPLVVTANYLTVAFSLSLYLLAKGAWVFPPGALYTGLSTGAVFISSMLLMNHALTIAPVGSVLTAFRISIVVPVVVGIYFWGEPMAPGQLLGLLLALVALGLMTSNGGGDGQVKGAKAFGLLIVICLWQGMSHTCLRSVHYNGLDEVYLQVLMVTGTTAGLVGALVIFLKKGRWQWPAVALGVFIGLYNALALCVIMIGLSKLPGTLFFPALGCGVVLLDNLFAHFYWKERLSPPAMAGVALAAVAVVLVI